MSRTDEQSARQILTDAYTQAFEDCQKHAASCYECCMPIVDEEGNPGYFGEACKAGHGLLKRYTDLEAQLLQKEDR